MKIKRPSLKGIKNTKYLGHFAQDKYIQQGHNFSGRFQQVAPPSELQIMGRSNPFDVASEIKSREQQMGAEMQQVMADEAQIAADEAALQTLIPPAQRSRETAPEVRRIENERRAREASVARRPSVMARKKFLTEL